MKQAVTYHHTCHKSTAVYDLQKYSFHIHTYIHACNSMHVIEDVSHVYL